MSTQGWKVAGWDRDDRIVARQPIPIACEVGPTVQQMMADPRVVDVGVFEVVSRWDLGRSVLEDRLVLRASRTDRRMSWPS